MVKGHWQIANHKGRVTRYGRVQAVPLDEVDPDVLAVGLRAASLFGDGFFGVDVKGVDGRILVMEVNDNPNLDAGFEDGIDKDGVYGALAEWFRVRLDRRGNSGNP
jgi:glutathione synthase/RimK-type ligase-like ATP-grasp enzyme